MAAKPTEVELSEEQVLYFRARRGHLAGPGAADIVGAARDLIGAQAQQIAPALIALSQRTQGRPSAADVNTQLMESPRSLVRTWGQRGTLHVYDAQADWRYVNLANWTPGGRRGAIPPAATINKVTKLLDQSSEPWTRVNLEKLVPNKYFNEVKEHVIANKLAASTTFRFAAGRILWCITLNGDACLGHKVGAEQTYASRQQWFPDLQWPQKPTGKNAENEVASINVEMARRYLSLYGPATPKDVSHFFGVKVSEAKTWIAALKENDELISVECQNRKDLLALVTDTADLQSAPPTTIRDWPIRFLPLWDSMMMGHHDKSWTVPDDADRKRIWRAGAFVAATIIDRGKVVGIWSHKVRGKRLEVSIEPLSRWRTSRHKSSVNKEAKAIAKHLGLSSVDLTLTNESPNNL